MVQVKSKSAMITLASSMIESAYNDLIPLPKQKVIRAYLKNFNEIRDKIRADMKGKPEKEIQAKIRKAKNYRDVCTRDYKNCKTAEHFFRSGEYKFYADILGIEYKAVVQVYEDIINGKAI